MKGRKNTKTSENHWKWRFWSSQENAYYSWTEHASELGLVLFCRRRDEESYPIKKLEILNFLKSDFPDDFRKTVENHEKLAYCYIIG
jgi:hypothetical protein